MPMPLAAVVAVAVAGEAAVVVEAAVKWPRVRSPVPIDRPVAEAAVRTAVVVAARARTRRTAVVAARARTRRTVAVAAPVPTAATAATPPTRRIAAAMRPATTSTPATGP